MQDNQDRWTVQEAAQYLRLSTGSVYQLCQDQRLGHIRYGVQRGRIWITRQDCDQYLESCRVLAVAPVPQAPAQVPALPVPRRPAQVQTVPDRIGARVARLRSSR